MWERPSIIGLSVLVPTREEDGHRSRLEANTPNLRRDKRGIEFERMMHSRNKFILMREASEPTDTPKLFCVHRVNGVPHS